MANLPLPSKAALIQQFVGKSLKEIPLPAAVLDLAAIKRNCNRMTTAIQELGFDFRATVSAHKTLEITRLQLGDDPAEVRLLVYTVSEAENLLPLLLDYQQRGIQVNVLYAVPISASKVDRIAAIARILGKRGGNLRLLVDHRSQLSLLDRVFEASGYPPYIYISIDCGDHHSGVEADSAEFRFIFSQIEQIVLREGPISLAFVGFYSRMTSEHPRFDSVEALRLLNTQLSILVQASPIQGIRLSISTTPIVPYLSGLLQAETEQPLTAEVLATKQALAAIQDANDNIEIHDSVYSLMDLASFATDSEFRSNGQDSLTWHDIPLTILTEVSSLYPGRGADGTPEVLIDVGSSVLGVGPGEAYPCYGVLSQWNMTPALEFPLNEHKGWHVVRPEGECAVLVWKGAPNSVQPLQCGQRVRVYPNSAERVGSGFGWYFVIDSSRLGREDEIVDIYIRWRG